MDIPVRLVSNRQPSGTDLKSWPIQSPFENTKNLYAALSEKLPTLLYHLTERVHCEFESDDIFLGHPYFPHVTGRSGVTEIAFNEKIHPKKLALISPLHCDTSIETAHINRDYLDDVDKLMPSADILFAIMGQYWWDRWDQSEYAHWKPKMVRLDMAINVDNYPIVKKRFNKPGKRGYLFIGSSWDPRKGSDYFARLMSELKDAPCGWIGSGPDIPGVPKISGVCDLTPRFMVQIADTFDFFVSPARADPNPTTILECMSWGFPVFCTPQSGYYETEYRRNIYLDDLERSVEVLRKFQYVDEDTLENMAERARHAVETDYTWHKFCGVVMKGLSL